MNAFVRRRQEDLEKLHTLGQTTGNRLKVLGTSGNPINEIKLELKYITAGSEKYPIQKQATTNLTILLSSTYPLQEPSVSIITPIFHPNVYSSGRVCLGTKWIPTQGLDLLVVRIIQIITFDPSILNEKSPANYNALLWYRRALATYPEDFPTDSKSYSYKDPVQKKVTFTDVTPKETRKIVSCPSCSAQLSIPSGKSGIAKCTKCTRSFEVKA